MEAKNLISIEIDGVTYTPVYNFNTMAKFSERHGLTIEDFTKMNNPTIGQLISLAFLGIQEFCRMNKMEVPFDSFRIGALEPEKINQLILSISQNMMQLPKVERN